MLRTRVIPCLLIKNQALVKTTKFKDPNYVGDPVNTVRIFNEMEVDEILFLDITASTEKKKPAFGLIEQLANECFMPLAYGGGIRSFDDAKQIFSLGVEKIVINTHAIDNPGFIRKVAEYFGSQSVIVCIDVRKSYFGKHHVYNRNIRKVYEKNPIIYAQMAENLGAGELLVYSVDNDGVMGGFDINLVKEIVDAVRVPVIACGGAGDLHDMAELVQNTQVSGVATGSMVVYQGKNRAVLINFPDRRDLELCLR